MFTIQYRDRAMEYEWEIQTFEVIFLLTANYHWLAV